MSFDIEVEMKDVIDNLGTNWQNEINKHGFDVEIMPHFAIGQHSGGYLLFKANKLPKKYRFGLPQTVQVAGFDAMFSSEKALFSTSMHRTIPDLILQCYGAACLTVVTDGTYFDPQTGECFGKENVIARADWEIMAYESYIDEHSKKQRIFTSWSDYLNKSP